MENGNEVTSENLEVVKGSLTLSDALRREDAITGEFDMPFQPIQFGSDIANRAYDAAKPEGRGQYIAILAALSLAQMAFHQHRDFE